MYLTFHTLPDSSKLLLLFVSKVLEFVGFLGFFLVFCVCVGLFVVLFFFWGGGGECWETP